MTTQTHGKGKKKNKETMKLTLDEFNQIDAPVGHSVVSLKVTGLDWAETMADYDQKSTAETQQIIVPTAPRAQRGPNVDFDSLPNEPPFRVSLFNLPMSMEEKEINEKFFPGLSVVRIEISKQSTTVEFSSKDDMYEALCKDGSLIKNRTVNVLPYGQEPPSNYSDRYGGRGGGGYGDRYGDRQHGGGFGARSGDRFGDRQGSGFGGGRDRDSGYTGFNRSGYNQPRNAGGFGDRFQAREPMRDSLRGQYTSGASEAEAEESTNWRARPNSRPSVPVPPAPAPSFNGSRQPFVRGLDPRQEPSSNYQRPPPSNSYQQESYHQSRHQHHNQPHNNAPYSQQYNQSNSRPLSSSSTEDRPKLVLKPRQKPLDTEDVPVSRNEAIFGKAKPSALPYQKMNEIEEKLKAVQISKSEKSEPASKTQPEQQAQPTDPPHEQKQQAQQQQNQPSPPNLQQ